MAVIDRVLARLETSSGCWLWTGATGWNGYGKIDDLRVHRVAYEHFVGSIPDGMTVEHVCHTSDPTCPGGKGCQHRRCCNPEHLTLETRGDNSRLGAARKTHCKHGHEFTPENTAHTGKQRVCIQCRRDRARRWKKTHDYNGTRRARRAAARAK